MGTQISLHAPHLNNICRLAVYSDLVASIILFMDTHKERCLSINSNLKTLNQIRKIKLIQFKITEEQHSARGNFLDRRNMPSAPPMLMFFFCSLAVIW